MNKKWHKLYEHSAKIVCPYCLKPIEANDLSVEHEPPRSRKELGGSKQFFVHKHENNDKGSLTYAEYMVYSALNRVRNGQRNERDLGICKRIRELFGSEFVWESAVAIYKKDKERNR